MGLLKGLGKIAGGVFQIGYDSIPGGGDGGVRICLKCGMLHGVCNCAISNGSKDLSEGVKEVVQSTSTYKKGRIEAKKEGYVEASSEYEDKLRKQAQEFLSQRKTFEKERIEYEQLLDNYERCIDKLEQKVNRTEKENELLLRMLSEERKLRQLGK